MKRILLLGSVAPLAMESYFAEAFRALGIDATVFDPEHGLAIFRKTGIRDRLTAPVQPIIVGRALDAFMKSYVLGDAVLVFKGRDLAPKTLRRWRRLTNVPWLNLNPDNPFDSGHITSSRHIRAALSDYDAYFIWSRALVPRIEAAGCPRVVYLPFAHNPATHFPPDSIDTSLSKTITFVGTHDRLRAATLEAIADLPIQVLGPHWYKLPRGSRLHGKIVPDTVYPAAMRRIVGSSLASINMLRRQNDGAHNMRTFEVPAMGGLLLTTRSAEQHEFFPEGEASLMYGDAAELRHVVQRLLRGDYDVAGMKAQALARASEHSYLRRASSIVSMVREIRGH
jgi:spore maturation protein CgeB